MAQKLIVRRTCPLCKNQVDDVPDYILKKPNHSQNAEFVVTRCGIKQYYHTTCWNEMISNQKQERAHTS